jgi:hypothetical protein
MRELAELQGRFGSALDARDSETGALEMFVGDFAQIRHRLDIYRGNTTASTHKALEAAYPVIARIVGTEFFSGLAREYRLRFPSHDGDLNEYGEFFAAFLADFAPAHELPYLPDVARLEWHVHCAHYAADVAPFDAARLASVPLERQLELRPLLHPACAVLHSTYPLARLWQVHQDTFGGEFEVDFSRGPGHALVLRPGFKVEVALINDAEAAFLAAAHGGATLVAALSAAQSRGALFDLGRSLASWVESSVIVDFSLQRI